jgi:DNA-directed RNA polymerase specialized sigma24 family protein
VDSLWQTTCSAIRAGADPDWEAICNYRQSLLTFTAIRYPWLTAPDREDLVHDILVELRAGLAHRYKSGLGRFRAFLCGVVRNKVLSRWKRARKQVALGEFDEPAAAGDDDGAAIDTIAETIGAVRRWYDRTAQGGGKDATRARIFAARLGRGEEYREIAAREGASQDAVKRVLSAAREEIFADLLANALPLADGEKAALDWRGLAARIREAIERPERRGAVLESLAQRPVREAAEAWLESFERMRRSLAGGETAAGAELRRGLDEIFAAEAAAEA